MAKHRFGIMGCGTIADFHAAAIADIDNAELTAVTDIIEGSARRVGEAQKVDWYTDHHDFLAREDIDIVTICTPSGAHRDLAVDAAKAGKHVIVEKPIEVTLERADAIIQASDEAGVKLCGIFPSRFHEYNKLLKKTIEEGRFGRLTLGDVYVKWWRTQEYYDSGGWRGTWRLDGGGALMNQSIHAIDLLQWLMGPVRSVMAFTGTLAHERIEVEDTAVAALRFENGALGVIEGTTSVYPGFLKKVQISGDKGSVFLEEEDVIHWEFADATPKDEAIKAKFSSEHSGGGGASDPKAISHVGHRKQFEDVINAVETDGAPLVDGREARKAVEIILAIYKSSREGKVVELPL